MGRSGTGLGLTVVWNTIRDHNGDIRVESDKNGTTFTIYLPATRKKIKDEGPEQEHSATTLKELQGKQEKILIVDDEEMQRKIAEELLNSLGYQTQTAASGEEGIELLAKNPIDLVLLDMIMDPGINGRQTYARMTEIKPNLKAVIASGFSENDEVQKALTFGPCVTHPDRMTSLTARASSSPKNGFAIGIIFIHPYFADRARQPILSGLRRARPLWKN